MDKMKYIILWLLGVFLCIPAVAQRGNSGNSNRAARQETPSRQAKSEQTVSPRNRVEYHRNSMKQVGDSLVIDMDIDMSRMDLKANHAQIITPVIGSSAEEIELPRVMIQGTAKNKAFMRELELNDKAYEEFENNLPYAIVKPKGKLQYRMSVPFEPWMSDAFLDVEEDLCGCGDQSKIARSRVFESLTKDIIADPVYQVRPKLAYIQPAVEPLKKRIEIGNAYLDFPRGKNDILPNFGNNATELAKIDKMIQTIATNKDITVQGVQMVGYASPESSVKFNTELSRARSESMMRYFMNNSTIQASLFETRTGGEDWEGLRRLLEDYPLSNKSEIFRLMNTISDLDVREKAISKVGDGRPYKIMYEELYPKLRRVVCEINYTVKDFSLEEAKENLSIAPQLLSLNEMYIVANTYEPGSPEFLKVFEVAREEFPDDPVANLNGAAAALAKNNLREAERYLKLADPSTPEYANNMGVFLMLKGNYREAEKYLKRAEQEGIADASINSRELKKKLANINNRREAGVDENRDDDKSPQSSSSQRRKTR
jgi:tetratricopeptide (TPR) repeat protein